LDGIASFMKTHQTFSNEGVRGRIVDAITYLTLIGGMIEEREGNDVNPFKVGDYVEVGDGHKGYILRFTQEKSAVVKMKDTSECTFLLGGLVRC
jgi:hypothetical protein